MDTTLEEILVVLGALLLVVVESVVSGFEKICTNQLSVVASTS